MPTRDRDAIPIAEWQRQARRWSIRAQGPTTVCYASLCRYAAACPNKSARPRRLLQSKCPRYWPEEVRPASDLSAYVQELLARSKTPGQQAKAREA